MQEVDRRRVPMFVRVSAVLHVAFVCNAVARPVVCMLRSPALSKREGAVQLHPARSIAYIDKRTELQLVR